MGKINKKIKEKTDSVTASVSLNNPITPRRSIRQLHHTMSANKVNLGDIATAAATPTKPGVENKSELFVSPVTKPARGRPKSTRKSIVLKEQNKNDLLDEPMPELLGTPLKAATVVAVEEELKIESEPQSVTKLSIKGRRSRKTSVAKPEKLAPITPHKTEISASEKRKSSTSVGRSAKKPKSKVVVDKLVEVPIEIPISMPEKTTAGQKDSNKSQKVDSELEPIAQQVEEIVTKMIKETATEQTSNIENLEAGDLEVEPFTQPDEKVAFLIIEKAATEQTSNIENHEAGDLEVEPFTQPDEKVAFLMIEKATEQRSSIENHEAGGLESDHPIQQSTEATDPENVDDKETKESETIVSDNDEVQTSVEMLEMVEEEIEEFEVPNKTELVSIAIETVGSVLQEPKNKDEKEEELERPIDIELEAEDEVADQDQIQTEPVTIDLVDDQVDQFSEPEAESIPQTAEKPPRKKKMNTIDLVTPGTEKRARPAEPSDGEPTSKMIFEIIDTPEQTLDTSIIKTTSAIKSRMTRATFISSCNDSIFIHAENLQLKSCRKRSQSFCVEDPNKSVRKNNRVQFNSPLNMEIDIPTIDTRMQQSAGKRRKRSMSEPGLVKALGEPAEKKATSRIKVPNFMAIHEQNFKKMESISEHLARKAERSKQILSASKSPMSSAKKIDVKNVPTNVSKLPPKFNFVNLPTKSAVIAVPVARVAPISTTPAKVKPVVTVAPIVKPKEVTAISKPVATVSRPVVKAHNVTVGGGLNKANTSTMASRSFAINRDKTAQRLLAYKQKGDDGGNDETKKVKRHAAIKGVRSNRRFELQMQFRDRCDME